MMAMISGVTPSGSAMFDRRAAFDQRLHAFDAAFARGVQQRRQAAAATGTARAARR